MSFPPRFPPPDYDDDYLEEQEAPWGAPSSGPQPWQVATGQTFTAVLADPGGVTDDGRQIGARVEAPITRAIVTAWQPATLVGGIWTVTLDGPLAPGAYQLVWRTNDPEPPHFEAFVPMFATDASDLPDPEEYPLVDVDAITPTVDEIAQLEATRTRDDAGNDKGTFDEATYPTETQVAELIGKAIEGVTAVIPDRIDPGYYPRVKTAVELWTAILVETSFFRVQGQGGAGPSNGAVLTYRQMLTDTLAGLTATVTGTGLPLA